MLRHGTYLLAESVGLLVKGVDDTLVVLELIGYVLK